ncbi:MAG: hypothetical protein GY927_08495 [bacterium]|nr:hypothetical protein [bacterium]
MKKLLCAMMGIAFSLMAVSSALAVTVIVDSKANGSFGTQNGGSIAMIGFDILGGTTINISASGIINIGGGLTSLNTDAAGIPLSFFLGDPILVTDYTPLQEAAVDAGGTAPGAAPDFGALMGAFVSATFLNANPGFVARDEDLVTVGIQSTALFLIGLSSSFTALEDGKLFLGVNDTFTGNNSGSFTVDITTVPLPAALPLFGTALSIMGLIGWRRKRKLA